jgi:uncharacterized protein YyaL (SSP411 family)
MAHESFEDSQVAHLLNEHFVSIKLDREERPDIDKVYQLAHQLLTGRPGGWPLTLFCNPTDLTPFFAGTYFPLTARHGLPGFKDVLKRVIELVHNQPSQLISQGLRVKEALERIQTQASASVSLNDQPFIELDTWLSERFDGTYGGFGGAPKFPHTEQLEYLYMRYAESVKRPEPDLNALYRLSLTLTRMAEGGVYDQIAGGFFRYSVDSYWMIPHFEKMLYDNGLLLSIYSKAALLTGERLFIQITRQLADWLLRDFSDSSGLFVASQDADSLGHEGLYYLWNPQQLAEVLKNDDLNIFTRRFGLDRSPNFEQSEWHLHAHVDRNELAGEFKLDVATIDQSLETSRLILKKQRDQRVAPTIDPKLIVAWNAMAIEGLIQASIAVDEPRYLKAAQAALDQLDKHAWVNNRLVSVIQSNEMPLPAVLDDVAFLLKASLASLQAEYRACDEKRLFKLINECETYFKADDGGYWYTAHDSQKLINRPRSVHDEAIPSAAAIATQTILRTGFLFGKFDYLQSAQFAINSVSSTLATHPAGMASWLSALSELQSPPTVIILRGPASRIHPFVPLLRQRPGPHRLHLILADEQLDPAGCLTDKPSHPEGILYVCDGFSCQAPLIGHDNIQRRLTAL